MSDLDARLETLGNAEVLRLRGSAGMWSIPDLQRAVNEVIARRPRLAVLDLAGLEFLTSLGMAEFVRLTTALRAEGGRVVAAAAQPDVDRALRRSRLDALIPMHASVEAALGV